MKQRAKQGQGLWWGAIAAAALTACGGGGSDPAPAPVTPTSVTISGKAVDGPLQGAIACYDLNDNGLCDADEPTSGPSDATGAFSFSVAADQAGKHRVVVQVPATAIDADTGAAVGTAFTLQSPATGTSGAQSVFASPLTTLVQAHVDATGATLAAASEFVKAQAGLAISPLADFTASNSADSANAAKVARLVQVTTLQQTAALATVAGTVDLSGNTISTQDVAKAVTQAVVAALPTVAQLVKDPAIANASGTALQQAVQAAAQTVVAQTGLDAATVVGQITANKAPPDTSAVAPVAGGTLAALRWTDPNNWYYRALVASAADNTPDANGKLRFYDLRQQSASSGFSANGVMRGWANNTTLGRSGDLHWNGSAWIGCTLGDRYESTVRDAQGRNTYDFCFGYEKGAGVRSSVDIAGKTLASVFTDTIRKYPGGASGVAYANWGPADPAAAFGSATFPAGARLLYQTNTVTDTAIGYDVQSTGVVTAFSAEVAAGGDARNGATPACSVVANQVASNVTTLEQLVARNPGQPCIFGKSVAGADSSLDPNEWWSNGTASLGIVAGGVTRPAGTGNWYSTDQRLRVAFAASGNGTTYYSCLSRATNGSARNCTAVGTGTYAIQTLGDARVMTFTGVPADARSKLGYDRVFVERAGQVYFGFKNLVGTISNQLRLNLEASNAVLRTLGLPPVQPTARYADLTADDKAALATAQGVFAQNSDTEAIFFRFGEGGRFLMAQAGPENTQTREVTGLELGVLSYRAADGGFATTLELDTNLTAGTSHPGVNEPRTGLRFSATGLTTPTGEVFPRATNVAGGIVGVWALGSATELRTQHFVFFANGRVLMIDPLGDTSGGACTQANQGPPGAEYASYTFDAATRTLRVFGKLYDTNGCAGFFDSSAGAVQAGTANTEDITVLTFSADGKTATTPDGSTVYRITP